MTGQELIEKLKPYSDWDIKFRFINKANTVRQYFFNNYKEVNILRIDPINVIVDGQEIKELYIELA